MKIIIVDSCPLFRKGLIAEMSGEPIFEVIEEASNVHEALSKLESIRPDFTILDLNLNHENGWEIIESAKNNGLKCKFIILTSSSKIKDFNTAKKLDVRGYILKDTLPEELMFAIKIIIKGRKYYDPSLFCLIMNRTCGNTLEYLTNREQEVLEAIGKGLKNQEIADQLYISEYTVKKHVSQILAKLEVADRTKAALYVNGMFTL